MGTDISFDGGKPERRMEKSHCKDAIQSTAEQMKSVFDRSNNSNASGALKCIFFLYIISVNKSCWNELELVVPITNIAWVDNFCESTDVSHDRKRAKMNAA